MKEHPIIFSAPMVRAILEGRKTQTRRIVKPQPWLNKVGQWLWERKKGKHIAFHPDLDEQHYPCIKLQHVCLYGQPGDRLWVRESFQALFADGVEDHYQTDYKTGKGYRIYYMATDARQEFVDAEDDLSDAITPSIFMPRWASRITLEIVGVRCERLQEISVGDCCDEGAPLDKTHAVQTWYAELWDEINSKRAPWASNPWVWVLEFQRAA